MHLEPVVFHFQEKETKMEELQEPVPFQEPVSSVWSVESGFQNPQPPCRRIRHKRGNRVWTEVRPTELHECLCGDRGNVNNLSDREVITQVGQEVTYFLESSACHFGRGIKAFGHVLSALFS